ncbi:hypothetical protein [Bacteroides sp.]|uniref:hypothetical protein n=1 Tax=Bacteroides sp. TaxID=29523 RepID=UPI002636E0AB|nr:hypothetical protein [Bacteroides sp.]MDD3039714.1 hypothetical protein [Bacteroides sp.]
MKNGTFETELGFIDSDIVKDFVDYCLARAPEYFYTMPASTTGKYHPAYTLGNGGLVRHTKAAVRIAEELLRLEQYSHLPHDTIISALILHDVIKKGDANSQWTATEHPVLACAFVEKCLADCAGYLETIHGPVAYQLFIENVVPEMCDLIRSHMGQWNTNKFGQEIMPKPFSSAEKFVHLCDYLASRKFITCEVD